MVILLCRRIQYGDLPTSIDSPRLQRISSYLTRDRSVHVGVCCQAETQPHQGTVEGLLKGGPETGEAQ